MFVCGLGFNGAEAFNYTSICMRKMNKDPVCVCVCVCSCFKPEDIHLNQRKGGNKTVLDNEGLTEERMEGFSRPQAEKLHRLMYIIPQIPSVMPVSTPSPFSPVFNGVTLVLTSSQWVKMTFLSTQTHSNCKTLNHSYCCAGLSVAKVL